MSDLKGKELKSLTEVSLQNKEKLDVSNNLLQDFDGIEQVQENLKWLNASHNQITSVKHLKVCTKLNVLNLSFNKLQSTRNLHKLKELKALILNNNELQTIDGIQMLKELNTLVVSGNQLDVIDVTSLVKLQKFSASHNKLTSIPNLQQQKDIKDLKLNSNQLEELPEWLPVCKRIKVLDVGNNELQSFDSIKVLNQLPFLENLNLKGNPLCEIEDYYIKMKEMLPNLKILDFKKMSELYFKAIEDREKTNSTNKSASKESKKNTIQIEKDNENVSDENIAIQQSVDVRKERGFKSKLKPEQDPPKENAKVSTSDKKRKEKKRKKSLSYEINDNGEKEVKKVKRKNSQERNTEKDLETDMNENSFASPKYGLGKKRSKRRKQDVHPDGAIDEKCIVRGKESDTKNHYAKHEKEKTKELNAEKKKKKKRRRTDADTPTKIKRSGIVSITTVKHSNKKSKVVAASEDLLKSSNVFGMGQDSVW